MVILGHYMIYPSALVQTYLLRMPMLCYSNPPNSTSLPLHHLLWRHFTKPGTRGDGAHQRVLLLASPVRQRCR